MVDTISAPVDELCAHEACGRLRENHGVAGFISGHHFVAPSQLASSKPRPADPLRDIRKMTEQDKARAVEVERTFADSKAPLPRKVREEREMEQQPEDMKPRNNDTRPCEVCGRPRKSHRGSIDHHYQPMGAAAVAAREEKKAAPESSQTAVKRPPKSRQSARPKYLPAPRKSKPTEAPTFLELATEIDELRVQLEQKVALMREMLA